MGTEVHNLAWAQQVAERIKKKMKVVAERNRHVIPYTTINGKYEDLTDKNICWWTNGFWGGMMWQLYHATTLPIYKEMATEVEKKLDRNLMDAQGMDHDSGFRWLPTAVANFRLTGSKEGWNRGILAADNLAGRFNPKGGFIRAWNDNGDGLRAGWAIIDCMMNLPLLYWAYEERKDPRYLEIAQSHADTAMKNFIREDGSVKHIVEFNPKTGEYVRNYGGQGYDEHSSWTRGQAWGLYGFTLSYQYTKKKEYLHTAEKIAGYFIDSIPESLLIPVDFRQPKECTWEDSTATVIACCGLLELAKHTGNKKYQDVAVSLLKVLEEKRCSWSEEQDNIVERCTAAYHDKDHEFAIIYGDYFFIEAIFKLTGEALFIW